MSDPVLEVLSAGLLTTIQDTLTRRAGRYGVSPGGALDRRSAALANALAGNPASAALLEITLVGPTLRLLRPATLGLAGAELSASLDGRPVDPGWSVAGRAGSTIEFHGKQSGVRAYLAVSGGVDVPLVLGSRSTDLAGGFGGLAGRPLRQGDLISAYPVLDATSRAGASARQDLGLDRTVRVLPGPHLRRFSAGSFASFLGEHWRVSSEADRMGLRLNGAPLRHRLPADVPSLGLPTGAIQVPGDGRPIVLLADHQSTGGYPVIACVVVDDLPLVAQRAPGDPVRFAAVRMPVSAAAASRLDLDRSGWDLARGAGGLT
ncbi:MAG: biotin-dependent carboxyltransferase family protein [Dehalococcoidia bacterium]